jgi:ABC transporter, substrate-binding protein, family 1
MLSMGALGTPISAAVQPVAESGVELALERQDSYGAFLKAHDKDARPEEEIPVPLEEYLPTAHPAPVFREESGKTGVLVWEEGGGKAEWRVTVPQAGLYELRMTCLALSAASRSLEFSLAINDQKPYRDMGYLEVSRTFRDSEAITQDNRGNDLRPLTEAETRWVTERVSDKSGSYGEPYLFYLQQGENHICLENQSAVAIAALTFCPSKPIQPYAVYKETIPEEAVSNAIISIQAESPLYKSDTVLFPTTDRSNGDTQPNDPVKLKLNTIGQSSWKEMGQYIVWNVPVEKAGYYKIALRYRQNQARGLTSYRKLTLNGETPFQEMEAIPFSFSDNWQYCTLGNGGEAYLFYFKEGNNELRLECVPGPTGTYSALLEDISYLLNGLYRQIIMITSTQPDMYRDYQLDREIPDLLDTLETATQGLRFVQEGLLELSGQNGLSDGAATLETLCIQMAGFIERSDTIPLRLSSFQGNLSALADFAYSLRQQPLELDYLVVASPENKEEAYFKKAGFWNNLRFHIEAFLGSFTTDYTSIGDVEEGEKAVTVWVGLGRDQAQVIKNLSDNLFTPDTGIPVNVQLVQQNLIPAILSGRGPDISLFCGAGDPVNLACREGLAPLQDFPGFVQIAARFSEQALIPYRYKGNVYALPLTENFPVLFYRTDIFNELGLKPPRTWEEFYKVLNVLQRNNMTAGIPNMTSGQMAANTSIYLMLLYQMGGSLYNENQNATRLSEPGAIEAFDMWTGFYSKQSLPAQYTFFQRFRTGEMPIALESYTSYNMLEVAAPELKGLWAMAPIPGLEQADGSIKNTAVASGTCAVMLQNSQNKDAAFRYLDWFTSTDAQVQYGLEIEAVLGSAGRYDTANMQAFEGLPWNTAQAAIIRNEWQGIVEIPQIPGSYYLDRCLTNAFRKTVYSNKNPRETLLSYDRELNAEIQRKREEFHLD